MFEDKEITGRDFKDMAKKLLGLFALFTILTVLLYFQTKIFGTAQKPSIKPSPTPASIIFRDGDIIFQQATGEYAENISGITKSPLNHCGLVIIKNNEVYVIEAADKVRLVKLEEWTARGKDKKFALLRFADLAEDRQQIISSEAMKFLNKPYDYKYAPDDREIYCSELVYKAYFNGIKVKIAPFIKLRNLDYKGHEEFIKKLFDGKLPLDVEVVTPDSIYKNKDLTRVYDDFSE